MTETRSGPSEALSCLKGKELKIDSNDIYETFVQEIEKHPEKAQLNGLYFKGKFMSYLAVYEAARSLACKLEPILRAQKAKSSIPLVALAIDRSDELVVASLAVISLGYGCLPLESAWPKDRVKNILAFAKPLCVLMSTVNTKEKFFEEGLCGDIGRVVLDDPEFVQKEKIDDQQRPERIKNNVLAVHFTSGSTGTPKGVIYTHESLMNRLAWQWNTLPWLENEVAVFKVNLASGDFPPELFSAMLPLIPIVIFPSATSCNVEQLVCLLEEYTVYRGMFVPSMLRSILTLVKFQHPKKRLKDLKLWVSNSEMLPPEIANDLMDNFPNITLVNCYGSTENTADITYEFYENQASIAEKCQEGRLSIGTPFHNSNIYVVNEAMELLPVGELGEICLSGIQNVGYLCPDTGIVGKDKFIPNPFTADANHTVLYKSGDYGKIVDGRTYFYGRKDDQVKVLGYVVDPVDIQEVVRGLDGIERVEFFCYNISEYMPAVVIFYILKEGTENVKPEDVKEECQRRLPSYIAPIPIEVDSIPALSTGKIDRQALRQVFETRRMQPTSSKRDGESKRRVLKIVAGVLFLSEAHIPVTASFKQLGGDSMSAVQCFVKLREEGYDISLEDVLTSENMGNLIERCVNGSSQRKEKPNELHVKALSDNENQEPVVNIVVQSFLRKNILIRAMQITYEQLLPRATALISSAATPSVVVTDQTTGKLLGVDMYTDFHVDINLFKGLDALEELISESKRKAEGMIVSKGLLCHSAVGVDVDLPPAERIRVILLVEEEAMRRAQTLGYRGVIGFNMNSVMQRVWEENLGYITLFSTNISQFETKGKRPFEGRVSQDACLKTMIRFF